MQAQGLAPLLDLTARSIVGAVFVYAGMSKALNIDRFTIDIARYQLVNHAISHKLAILLPIIEITAGIAILIGLHLRAATLVAMLLLLIFSSAIVIRKPKSRKGGGCGCGLPGDGKGYRPLLRNILLLVLGGYIVLYDEAVLQSSRHFVDRDGSVSDVVALAIIVIVTIVLAKTVAAVLRLCALSYKDRST